MGSSDTVVLISELPPNQAKYCLFICFFAMLLQERGFRPNDWIVNGRAATLFRLSKCSSLRGQFVSVSSGGGMLLLLCHSESNLDSTICRSFALA